MIRLTCFITGLVLAVSPWLLEFNHRSQEPSLAMVGPTRGGYINMTQKAFRCDGGPYGQGGQSTYVGCTTFGGSCFQCVNTNPDGSTSGAQYYQTAQAGPGDPTGYQYDPNGGTQACGNGLSGICYLDWTSPSGFVCTGTPAGACQAQPAVIVQTSMLPPSTP